VLKCLLWWDGRFKQESDMTPGKRGGGYSDVCGSGGDWEVDLVMELLPLPP
jgi:hypothetical protein